MESRVDLLWTAHCRGRGNEAESDDFNFSSSSYHLQRRFSLRYFPYTSFSVTLDGFRFDSVGGGYFFTPPDRPFQLEIQKTPLWEYYDINFLPHDPVLCEHLKAPLPPRQVDTTTKIMLDYIIENWHREDPSVRQNCNDFLNALLLLLFAGQTRTEASGSQYILTNGYSKATLSALNYIEQHLYSHFSLDELSQATSYNKSYLCAAFSENTGVSIVTYTNFLRIRKAIGSILYFPQPFNHMASSLGFENPNYFGRTFRTFTGITPRDFNLVARRMTPEEKANLYASEPLLNYRRHPLEEVMQSMRHIGELFKAQSEQAK